MASGFLENGFLNCNTDEECRGLLMDQAQGQFIPVSASRCYDDIQPGQGTCGCSAYWGWTGRLCDQVSVTSNATVVLFAVPLLASCAGLLSRTKVFFTLVRKKLLMLNSTGVAMTLCLSTLVALILLTSLYIVACVSPNSALTDFIRIGDYLILCMVILSQYSLVFSFLDIIKKFADEKQKKKIIVCVALVTLMFGVLVALSFTGLDITAAAVSASALFISIASVFLSKNILFVRFSDSFRMGVTRREKWKTMRGGSVLIGTDVSMQLIKYLLFSVDVAAGRDHSDLIKQVEETASMGKKSSKNLLSEMSHTRSHSMDSTASLGIRWGLPMRTRMLSRDDSFNSQLGIGKRDQSYSDVGIHSRTNSHSNVDQSDSVISRKDLSYASKKYVKKIIRFLGRVMTSFIGLLIATGVAMTSLSLSTILEHKFNSELGPFSGAMFWRAMLLLSYSAVENAILWFVEDAACARIKHTEEAKRNAEMLSKSPSSKNLNKPSALISTALTPSGRNPVKACDGPLPSTQGTVEPVLIEKKSSTNAPLGGAGLLLEKKGSGVEQKQVVINSAFKEMDTTTAGDAETGEKRTAKVHFEEKT